MVNIDKLNKLASGKSKWMEEAKERQKNKDWLKHSQKIAIKVLKALREKGIKQKQLAERIGVSPQQVNKIVKGRENLTLETISKLENALNIQLIFLEQLPQSHFLEYKPLKWEKEYVYLKVYTNKTFVIQKKSRYRLEEMCFSENQVNEKKISYG